MDIYRIRELAKKLKNHIGLQTYPVGVKFVFADSHLNLQAFQPLRDHRYCQALMKARHGESVSLDKHGIACPAAAAAFGFKELPPQLLNGKGLTGFGITREEDTGKAMFQGMSVFEKGTIKKICLFPLENAPFTPEVVVIEDKIENLMWVALAYLNATGGCRIQSSTAILQAACVDSTILPYQSEKMNLSYGCYGCRDATDIDPGETVLGFPFSFYDRIVEYVEYLSTKAIPRSREKNALTMLKYKSSKKSQRNDIFSNHSQEKG